MTEKVATVLVVDDDPDVLAAMRMILEANGFACQTASSAEEGLERFQESQPDLILADLMMEEVDSGTGFVRSLRLAGNKAPVFMLSSVGDALSATADPAHLGLAGIFQKPVDPATLVQTLRAALRNLPPADEPQCS